MKMVDESETIHLLNQGAVGIMPTDTLLGIVCRAEDDFAAEKLYKAKQRENKPGTVIAASLEQLVKLGLKKRYLRSVEGYWPNPISIVIPCAQPELDHLHLGNQSIAVRIPNNTSLKKILELTGPLLTSSANLANQAPARNLKEAFDYFAGTVDFYSEANVTMLDQPSTILRVIDDTVIVLRQGAVTIDETTGAIQQ